MAAMLLCSHVTFTAKELSVSPTLAGAAAVVPKPRSRFPIT